MSTLKRAIEIARQAHAGQVDKGGADYIGHPLRVMERGENEEQKIVGVLHDVVEDYDWTFEMLEEEGFAPAIIEALKCVTKLSEGEDYDDFISRVMTNPLAVKVKLYDIEDNLDVSRLDSLTDADVARCKKYLNARDRLKAELIRLESQQ
jgi:(p)ppGpp synthase/HD superfamily hydrolase